LPRAALGFAAQNAGPPRPASWFREKIDELRDKSPSGGTVIAVLDVGHWRWPDHLPDRRVSNQARSFR